MKCRKKKRETVEIDLELCQLHTNMRVRNEPSIELAFAVGEFQSQSGRLSGPPRMKMCQNREVGPMDAPKMATNRVVGVEAAVDFGLFLRRAVLDHSRIDHFQVFDMNDEKQGSGILR